MILLQIGMKSLVGSLRSGTPLGACVLLKIEPQGAPESLLLIIEKDINVEYNQRDCFLVKRHA